MTQQLAFHIDVSACIGCKACQIACKDKHDLPIGINWRRVLEYGGGSWRLEGEIPAPVEVFAYYLSLSCMHCEEPACMSACPTGAISKRDDGVVLVDGGKCLGCRYCAWACPYGAPQFGARRPIMSKCDFCADLLAQGQNPVCVDACPMRALHFGTLEELQARFGQISALEPLPAPEQTGPSVVLTPHRHARASGQGGGAVVTLSAT